MVGRRKTSNGERKMKPVDDTAPVAVRVLVPNERKCRVARALKMYADVHGIRSQANAVVKIIKENKDIREFIRQAYVAEIIEVKKARAAAIAESGLAAYDKMVVGRG